VGAVCGKAETLVIPLEAQHLVLDPQEEDFPLE
jgi:hypothetical protein